MSDKVIAYLTWLFCLVFEVLCIKTMTLTMLGLAFNSCVRDASPRVLTSYTVIYSVKASSSKGPKGSKKAVEPSCQSVSVFSR